MECALRPDVQGAVWLQTGAARLSREGERLYAAPWTSSDGDLTPSSSLPALHAPREADVHVDLSRSSLPHSQRDTIHWSGNLSHQKLKIFVVFVQTFVEECPHNKPTQRHSRCHRRTPPCAIHHPEDGSEPLLVDGGPVKMSHHWPCRLCLPESPLY